MQLAATAPASRSDLAVCVQTDRLTARWECQGRMHRTAGAAGAAWDDGRRGDACVTSRAERQTRGMRMCALAGWPAERDDAAAGAFCRGTRALRASQPGSPSAPLGHQLEVASRAPQNAPAPRFLFPAPAIISTQKGGREPEAASVARSFRAAQRGCPYAPPPTGETGRCHRHPRRSGPALVYLYLRTPRTVRAKDIPISGYTHVFRQGQPNLDST